MKYLIVLSVFLLGCSGQSKQANAIKSDITAETKNTIAVCSSQFSDAQIVYLEGEYLSEKARIAGGTNTESKGMVLEQHGMNGQEKLALKQMYYECIESHKQNTNTSAKYDLVITKSYMKPWGLFFKDQPIAFLSMDVMNLSNEPVLITSAEVSLARTNGMLKREGRNVNGMSFLPQSNKPVLIAPGEKKTVSINVGFQLDGLEPILNDIEIDKQPYFTLTDDLDSVKHLHATYLVEHMNAYLERAYGKDSAIEVVLYSGIKTEVYSNTFRLGDGKDLFDTSGNIDWSAFLGELAYIKQDSQFSSN